MLWQPTRGVLQPNQSWRRPQTPSGGGFTPPDLGAALLRWYDASDSANFTFLTGSSVATWLDLSGNGATLTRSWQDGTLTASVQNGLSALRVGASGTSTVMDTSTVLGGATALDGYMVFQFVTRTFPACGIRTENFQMLCCLDSSGHWGSYGGGNLAASTVLSAGTTYLIEATGNSSSGGTFYLKGVSDGTYPGMEGGSQFNVAAYGSGNQPINGYVMEVLVTTNLSSGNRASLEGYLVSKWGL